MRCAMQRVWPAAAALAQQPQHMACHWRMLLLLLLVPAAAARSPAYLPARSLAHSLTHPVRNHQLRIKVLLLVFDLQDAVLRQPASRQRRQQHGQQVPIELHLRPT